MDGSMGRKLHTMTLKSVLQRRSNTDLQIQNHSSEEEEENDRRASSWCLGFLDIF
jgi:hypothetical protein